MIKSRRVSKPPMFVRLSRTSLLMKVYHSFTSIPKFELESFWNEIFNNQSFHFHSFHYGVCFDDVITMHKTVMRAAITSTVLYVDVSKRWYFLPCNHIKTKPEVTPALQHIDSHPVLSRRWITMH